MKQKSDLVYIEIILDSVRKIEDFTRGLSKDEFLNNQMVQSATILHLVLIGENAKNISEGLKSKIDLPWRDIIGLRNVAVHEYVILELNIIWDTINRNIPELKAKLIGFKDSLAR